MKPPCARKKGHLRDWLLGAILLAVGAAAGMAYLHFDTAVSGSRYYVDTNYLPRAVMFASGRGFVYPVIEEIPGLTAFLNQEEAVFDPRRLPDKIPTQASPDRVESYHRYLVLAIGLTWRLFGIRWSAMAILMGLLFGASVLAAYGLFRLGMNRLCSTGATALFMMSPAMLTMLPEIRDFSKAPFLLGAMALMGYLATRRVGRGAFVGLSGLLGLIEGVGLGFRQDILVYLPLSVLVIVVLARGKPGSPHPSAAYGLTIGRRLLATALLLLCFGLPAAPMLVRMGGGGAQPSHPLTQGFSTQSRDNLGLAMASYEPLSMRADGYAYATVYSYERRVRPGSGPMTFNSPAAAEAGNRWFLEAVTTFPADVLARWYAAVLWTAGYVGGHVNPALETSPILEPILPLVSTLAEHMTRYRLWYLLAVLLLLSSHSLRAGFLFLFFLLYFCGYVSLSFQYRHAFHLCVVPIWLLGFLANRIAGTAGRLRVCLKSRDSTAEDKRPTRAWASPVRRMLLFCVLAALALAIPLYAARIYQRGEMLRMLERYATCRLEPVDVVSSPFNDWTLIERTGLSATPSLRARSCLINAALMVVPNPLNVLLTGSLAAWLVPRIGWSGARPWQVHTEYYAAEFGASPGDQILVTRYESASTPVNFSQILSIPPTNAGEKGTIRYFFPAYEVYGPMDTAPPTDSLVERPRYARGVFRGILLPPEEAARFRGLFRVKDRDAFRLLLNITVPEASRTFQPYQTLAQGQDHAHRQACEDDAAGWVDRALIKFRDGRKRQALRLYQAAVALRAQDTPVNTDVVAMLKDLEALEPTVGAFTAAIERDPESEPLCGKLDGLLSQAGLGSGTVADIWRGLVGRCQKTAPIYYHLGTALLVDGQIEEAIRAYEKALALAPNHPELREALLRARAAEAQPALPVSPAHAGIQTTIEPGTLAQPVK